MYSSVYLLMNDETKYRYEASGIEGPRVFVTAQAIKVRAAQLNFDRWKAPQDLVRWLHGDLVKAATRKTEQHCFEPDGSILITSADLII